MSNTTKISNHRAGSPRFGTRDYNDNWDNSVKISYLSPEELEEYRSGKRGGSKLFTYDDYQKMKDAGKSNAEIGKEMKISEATLYNRLKVWKKEPLQNTETHHETVQETDTSEKKHHECNCSGKEVKAKYEQMIADLRSKLDQASADKVKIQELRKEIDFWKKKVVELSSAEPEKEEEKTDCADYQELFHNAMDEKDNLHREIITLENRLENADKYVRAIQKQYNELLEKYYSLKEEATPLRQLVLMNLRNKLGILK